MLKRFDEDIDKSQQEKTATHEYHYKLRNGHNMLKRFDENIDKIQQEKTATHEYRYKLMLKTLCLLHRIRALPRHSGNIFSSQRN
jgi:hypothetical protein